jgi:hypothetical protein
MLPAIGVCACSSHLQLKVNVDAKSMCVENRRGMLMPRACMLQSSVLWRFICARFICLCVCLMSFLLKDLIMQPVVH